MTFLLANRKSFNFYVAHGGTNFGFTAGANSGGKGYEPDVTSYDYDAPIDEQGRATPKYHALRTLIGSHLPAGHALPPVPDPVPSIADPRFTMRAHASLWNNLPAPVASVQPKPFEAYGQNQGLVLYRTTLVGRKSGRLVITDLHDYANVFVDGTLVGTLDRRLGEKSIELPRTDNPTPVLDILVEGMGHINFAQEMIDRKGITDRVTLQGMTLMNWQAFLLPLTDAWVSALPAGAVDARPGHVLPRVLHARHARRHLHRHDRLPEGRGLGERAQPRPLLGHRPAEAALLPRVVAEGRRQRRRGLRPPPDRRRLPCAARRHPSRRLVTGTPIARTHWGLVLLLAATATAAYLCRVNISVAGALVMKEYGLTQTQMGWVFSAFLLGYTLLHAAGGLLADAWGARRTLAVLAWGWVAVTVLQAAVPAASAAAPALAVVGMLAALRFVMGALASPTYPAALEGVSRWTAPGAIGRANGLVIGSVGLGSAIAPPFITAVMVPWGWRAALVASAIPALLIAVVWLARRGSRADAARRHRVEPAGDARDRESNVRVVGRLLRAPGFALLTLSYTLQGYVGYIFIFWFYLYLVQVRRFSLVEGAFVSSLPWVLSAISIPLGGLISDRLVQGRLGPVWGRRLIPILGMGGAGVFISVGAHTTHAVAGRALAGGRDGARAVGRKPVLDDGGGPRRRRAAAPAAPS